MGLRPAGFSLMLMTFRSPYNVMARLRGIGVALITSMSGYSPLASSASRWLTPKRCCSSMMTRPSFAKYTSLLNRACVPMTTLQSPIWSSPRMTFFSAAGVAPTKSCTWIPAASKNGLSDLKCCLARMSVGTISAHCSFAPQTAIMASRATTVFPQPTSPCNSAWNCFLPLSPSIIVLSAASCPAVSWNGNRDFACITAPKSICLSCPRTFWFSRRLTMRRQNGNSSRIFSSRFAL